MDAQVTKILNDLKARKYAPVYFLQGEESYFIDLISDYIEKNVLSEAEKGFNQVVVYGKDASMSTILTHARRFPMMSNPPPPASDDSAEANWAASTADSCEAERPNSTSDRISSLGSEGDEARVISGRAAVPRIRTVTVSAGSARVASSCRRMFCSWLER